MSSIELPNGFAYALDLFRNEFQIEDQIEKTTDELLSNGQLGKRAPELYPQLGTALSLLSQIASCQWGCRGDDHLEENLIRRLVNYSFAALRLARLGLYNESLGMLRSVAEIANLIELFVVDKPSLAKWRSLPPNSRWQYFRPAKVRERIADTKNRPVVDEQTYGKFCDIGIHISPESAKLSHQFEGTVFVGGEFSATALLLVLNELAIMLSAALKLAGYLVESKEDNVRLLTQVGERLEATATDWLRITNYEERMREKDSESQTAE